MTAPEFRDLDTLAPGDRGMYCGTVLTVLAWDDPAVQAHLAKNDIRTHRDPPGRLACRVPCLLEGWPPGEGITYLKGWEEVTVMPPEGWVPDYPDDEVPA